MFRCPATPADATLPREMPATVAQSEPTSAPPCVAPSRTRRLVGACLTHALHDGYTDAVYAFLPVWQAQFGLSYAGLAFVRALYFGTMGALQIPADRALRGWSARAALVLSTLAAVAGLLIMALPLGYAGLCAGLVVAGVGSSIQHPRGSVLVTDTFGQASRQPLSIYNFSGDLGKAALPAAVAALLPLVAWRPLLGLMALLGVAMSIALIRLTPSRATRDAPGASSPSRHRGGRVGFTLLTVIGGFDTATRMGYLLFLPFIVQARGGTSETIGVALALLFAGGALGKATGAWLEQRVGVVGSVVASEAATALLIVATLFTPLTPTLVLLPALGVVLNGTSSVLYGTVPELAGGDTGRAFSIFYTGVIGSGAVAPILYGAVADHSAQAVGVWASAATAAAIVPLVLALRPFLTARASVPPCDTERSADDR
jgi:MFS transporter, FSR family, fosmidomycin resistance protein